jgi:hypothetical protein
MIARLELGEKSYRDAIVKHGRHGAWAIDKVPLLHELVESSVQLVFIELQHGIGESQAVKVVGE